ncbi:hypothetical protein CR513_21284, partial [Mucuna pruriens]
MAINAISHDSGDAEEKASRRKGKRTAARRAVKPACRMEEKSHLGRSNMTIANSIAYIERNGNPRPKPLIVHYNSASQTIVSFIVQVPARPVPNGGNNDTPSNNRKSSSRGHQYSWDRRDDEKRESLRLREPMKYRLGTHEMLDQLHKMPARISLLSLLINSESHRECDKEHSG